MAKIVLGQASSHAPQLEMPPEKWREYGDRSRTQAEHWFAGRTVSFEELVDLRRANKFENECTDEKFATRHAANQKAIAHLADTLNKVSPDVCIMLGDDQHEAFNDMNMPSIAIYHGDTVDDVPTPGGRMFSDPAVANRPNGRVSHPAAAELGNYLLESLRDHDFDLTRVNKLNEANHEGAIGHAFYYIYRRLMNNEVIPSTPIMVNTYYPPNVPTAKRCYDFGLAIRDAVEAWDSNKRVAIFASGGLSHTVIEEDLDMEILEGLKKDDVTKFTQFPDVRYRAGTSEIKNWIIVAGAMSGRLQANVVDYVPCYRTEGGNGCAMGFAEWL
jgi:hypothetical protein